MKLVKKTENRDLTFNYAALLVKCNFAPSYKATAKSHFDRNERKFQLALETIAERAQTQRKYKPSAENKINVIYSAPSECL